MDQRIDAGDVAQPQIERDEAMPRRTARVVILGGAVGARAAIGLRGDNEIAAAGGAKAEGAILDGGIGFRRPPLRDEFRSQCRIDGVQRSAIVGEQPAHLGSLQPPDQRAVAGRQIVDAIARRRQQPHNRDGAFRRVQPHRVGDLIIPPRIGRQHQRQLALFGRRVPQMDDGARLLHHRRNPLGIGGVADAGEAEIGIDRLRLLERHDAREHPAVDLRQHDVDGKIRRRQPALRFRPGGARGPCQRHLQHHGVGRLERRAVGIARRERGGVDDDVRLDAGKLAAQPAAGVRRLQAVDEHPHRRDATRGEPGHQLLDRLKIGGHQERAIEHDERAMAPPLPVGGSTGHTAGSPGK